MGHTVFMRQKRVFWSEKTDVFRTKVKVDTVLQRRQLKAQTFTFSTVPEGLATEDQ